MYKKYNINKICLYFINLYYKLMFNKVKYEVYIALRLTKRVKAKKVYLNI